MRFGRHSVPAYAAAGRRGDGAEDRRGGAGAGLWRGAVAAAAGGCKVGLLFIMPRVDKSFAWW